MQMCSQEWRKIETAPKDGTRMLLWPRILLDGRAPRIAIGHWHQPANDAASGFWIGPDAPRSPTHWMALPDPPD